MNYTLIGSLRSPFTRMIRLLLLQKNIPFQFKGINYLEVPDDAAAMARMSPMNKIPVLFEGEKAIFDSRVIFNYLGRKHGWEALSLDEENTLTAVYTAVDTLVSLFMYAHKGRKLEDTDWYVVRQRERVHTSLEYVAPWAAQLSPAREGDWNFISGALFSLLYWAQARGLLELSKYPELAAFVTRFQDAPFVHETDFARKA